MSDNSLKFSNRLTGETSPYLLQHAHNPVDWFPWGEEALQKARDENRVLLVSIGYAACHWCHVMERESFEDEATAQLMNELFINVKIDREERPDLDHIYMEAVQAMTGSGGWPLNVFLTPEQKPFYGGTYFPPVPAHGRSSWKEVLISIADAWQRRRSEIEEQADKLLEHVGKAAVFVSTKDFVPSQIEKIISTEDIKNTRENLLKAGDKKYGGFGAAPKFLQTQSIKFLFQDYFYSGNEYSLIHAELSLQQMIFGGIYDQVGGGISRYSTDAHWLVPHFEKMLYDNALLLELLSHAYSITGKPMYKYYLKHSFDFLVNEMKAPTGGFYAALDADSEGIEGKFYLWEPQEIRSILGADAEDFIDHFNIREDGNVPVEQSYWKGKNVLFRTTFPDEEKNASICSSLEKLYEYRSKRIPPATDDKIIMGWNCLLISAFCSCYSCTGEEIYKIEAVQLSKDIEKLLKKKSGDFYHSYAKGSAKHPAYLDDLVYYTQALLHLQEITADTKFVEKAKEITEYIFDKFYDAKDGYFFYSSSEQTDVVVRKKEFYDSAITAANAVHAENLYKLGAYFENDVFTTSSERMLFGLKDSLVKYPTSFATWAVFSQNFTFGLSEIAIVGADWENLLLNISKTYCPFKVVMAAKAADVYWPLLRYAEQRDDTYIYLCRNQLCFSPTNNIARFQQLISEGYNR